MALSPAGDTLYVACANTNQAAAIDFDTGTTRELITTSLCPTAPPSSSPNSLSLAADGQVLLVANVDNNNVAVFNVSEPGRARGMRFIPAWWYTTSVRMDRTGDVLYTAGKGLISRPNRNGPNPEQAGPRTTREYTGGLIKDSLCNRRPVKREWFDCAAVQKKRRRQRFGLCRRRQ